MLPVTHGPYTVSEQIQDLECSKEVDTEKHSFDVSSPVLAASTESLERLTASNASLDGMAFATGSLCVDLVSNVQKKWLSFVANVCLCVLKQWGNGRFYSGRNVRNLPFHASVIAVVKHLYTRTREQAASYEARQACRV